MVDILMPVTYQRQKLNPLYVPPVYVPPATGARVKLGAGAPEPHNPTQGFVGLEITQDHPHRVAKVAD